MMDSEGKNKLRLLIVKLEESKNNEGVASLLISFRDMKFLRYEFDWTQWTEGVEILDNKNTNYRELDSLTLRKLLFLISRANRFNEGLMKNFLKKGIIVEILLSLEKKL